MHRKAKRQVVAPLDIIPLSTSLDGRNRAKCVDCQERLDMHQPEVRTPDRLLGTCSKCGRWFLVLLAIGDLEAVLVTLPDLGRLRGDPGLPALPDRIDTPEIVPPL